jgi:hypothetical protein
MIIKIATQPVAYTPSTKNIAAPEAMVPASAVCHPKKWNEGRKLGAEPILRRKVARFITKNVICDLLTRFKFRSEDGA